MSVVLSETYGDTVERLSDATATSVLSELERVEPDENGELQRSFVIFVARAAAALEVGQRAALEAAAGYVRAAGAELGHAITPARTSDVVGFDPFGRTVGELLGTVPAATYTILGQGRPLPEALEIASVTARALAVSVVRDAAREALSRTFASAPEVRAWKWLSRGTCGACMAADDGSDREPGPPMLVHPNCQCVAEPVFEPQPALEATADWAEQTWLATPSAYMPEGLSRDLEAVWGEMTSALRHYQELGFEDVNTFLRSGGDVIALNLEELAARLRLLRADPFLLEDASLSERLSGIIRSIDLALELQAVPETIATYRGVGLDAFRKALAELGAGDDLTKLVGATLREDGFLSTSLEGTVVNFAVEMRMTVEAGTPAFYMGRVPGIVGGQSLGPVERELLLGRGLELTITSVERRGERWFVEVTVRRPG